jgi:uncharacterized membrane protein YedE/YeeE
MKALIYIVSLLLAAVLGFAVHRAGFCTVRTVAEIYCTRRAYMLAAILKAVLWVIAVSVPIFLFLPGIAAPNQGYAISASAIAGGFLFGVGAAINGGCAFSTLGHLANGNLWMLTTLFGFGLGVAGLFITAPMIGPSQAPTVLLFKAPKTLTIALPKAFPVFRLMRYRHSLPCFAVSPSLCFLCGFSPGKR